ncbi:hypothetical protein, partial [Crocosphaera sp.]|uniref:hypothetical protein n=1 Tax=Crocosphaera sp. TaxID=2729996 RepID=UPI00257EEC11
MSLSVSAELEQAINDGQRIITYIIRHGTITLDPDVANIIIDAKYKIANKRWTAQDENTFLIHYDKLSKIIYPVTVESIRCVIPMQLGSKESSNKRVLTKAESSVAWYRRSTLFALFLLLITQVYYLFGIALSHNLSDLFAQRETRVNFITSQRESGNEKWKNELLLLNQKFDANYKLLLLWNQVWSMGGEFSDTMPKYTEKKFELMKKQLNRPLQDNFDQLDQFELKQSLYRARLVYFSNLLSAKTMLT